MVALSQDVVVFVGLVVASAGFALLHLALWLRVMRTKTLGRALRVLAVLPPITAFAGFRARAWVLCALWCMFAAAYLVLRTLS